MRERIRRRMFPLIASVGLIAVGMFTTTWGPTLIGRTEWALPYDLWGTLIATTRLAHGNIGGLYAPPTGLISLPGAAVILLPCAALISALGLSLAIPGPANLHPAVWLLAGPYEIAHRLPAAVRRRRPGRAAWRGALDAGAAGSGRSRHPVVGLRPLGTSGGRGRRRAAALRGPRPGQRADRAARAGWPGRRSASSRWCCCRCRSCSPCCRGGGWRRSWSARRSPRRCCWPRRRSPTGTTPTSR